jgi:hypothetical protein
MFDWNKSQALKKSGVIDMFHSRAQSEVSLE